MVGQRTEAQIVERQIALRDAVRLLLREACGDDPQREGLRDTPARVVKAWQEMTSGATQCPKEILSLWIMLLTNWVINLGPAILTTIIVTGMNQRPWSRGAAPPS